MNINILKFRYVRIKPKNTSEIQVASTTPASIVLNHALVDGFSRYQWMFVDADGKSVYTAFVHGNEITIDPEDVNPEGTTAFVRGMHGNGRSSNWSEPLDLSDIDLGDPIVIETLQLLSATPTSETVTVAHNNVLVGVKDYVWQYKLAADSEWTTHGTIDAQTQAGADYVFTGLTNGEAYDFKADLTPEDENYTGSTSNVLQATPQATANPLAKPVIQSVTQPDNDTIVVEIVNPANAEKYVAKLKGVEQSPVALDVGTITTISFAITGADFGTSVSIEVKVTGDDAIFLDSAYASTAYVPYDVENTVELILEYDYFKALDGRVHAGITAPTLTVVPYAQMSAADKNYLATNGFMGTDFSKVTSSLASVFTNDDLDKDFCAMLNHVNTLSNPDRVDEFPPNENSSRYAKVVDVVDDQNIFVDFEYNGNAPTPTTKSGVLGFITEDARVKWETFIANLQANPNPIGKLHSYGWASEGNFRMKVYNWFNAATITLNDNPLVIRSVDSGPFLVRYGVEGMYELAHDYEDPANLIFNKPSYLFNIGGTGSNNIILSNGVFAPPLTPHKSARTYGVALFGGTGKPSGVVLAHNNDTYIEKDEIEEGLGEEDIRIQPISKFSNHNGGGVYAGSGLLNDVTTKLFIVETFAHREGDACLIQSGASGNGCTFGIYDGDYRHNNTKNNAPASRFLVKPTTDTTGLQPEIVDKINAGVYRGLLLEVVGGNVLVKLQMGGNNRYNWLRIGKYLLHLPNQGLRFADVSAYLDVYYNDGELPITDNISTSEINKVLLLVAIPLAGERYTVGRDYSVSHKMAPTKLDGTGSMNNYEAIQSNAGKTHAFGCDVTNVTGTFQVGEIVTYSGDGRQFICHENYNGQLDLYDPLDDKDRDALVATETLTGNTSGATAEVVTYHARRVTIARIKESNLHTQCFRNAIQWGVIQDKWVEDYALAVNPDIPANSYPQAWQPGCRYKIPQYLLLKSVNGLAVGDTISNGTASGVITNLHLTYDQVEMGENILDEQVATREKKWYCVIDADHTGFTNGDNLDNGSGGTAVLDRKSTHDETKEYTVKSMMGIIFPSNTGEVNYNKWMEGARVYPHSGANNGGGYGMYYILDSALPTELPMTYEVECTYSNIEDDLLDGDYHPCTQGYKSTGRVSSHLIEGTTTSYYKYTWPTIHGWLEDAQDNDGNFPIIAPTDLPDAFPENITYVRGNNNYDFRNTVLKGEFRENMAPFPAATVINLPGGGTDSVFPLYFYAKKHTLVNVDCSNLGGALSGSPEAKGHYFDEARILVDYLIGEGVLPAYSPEDYSRLEVYGAEEYDYPQRHSAENYVRDLDANNAPPIPTEIQTILTQEGINIS